jgi:SAM-dependent methyltransferase
MVNKALQVDGFTCQQGDICEVNMNKQYDAVLSLFHVISYQISNRKLQEVFKRASEHLKPGGIFLFDFWYTPAVNAQKPVVRIKRLANDFIEITRIAEPEIHSNENRVDVNYTIYARDLQSGNVQIMSEKHPMRHFTIPEIDLLASLNGFERIDAEEFLTGKPSGEDTWGVCVSLRKN